MVAAKAIASELARRLRTSRERFGKMFSNQGDEVTHLLFTSKDSSRPLQGARVVPETLVLPMNGVLDQLRGALEVEFLFDMRLVCFDRFDAEVKLLGDLAGR